MNILRVSCVTLIALASSLIFCTEALAQSPRPSPGERDMIQERQRRLLDEQRQRLDELQHLPPSPQQPGPGITQPQENCLNIRRIRLKDAHLIPEAKQRELLAPFEGQCLDSQRIDALLGVITKYYLDRGYITSRAYLPEQDLSSGQLEILIIEGRLEGFKHGENSPGKREIAMSFPGKTGERLQLRELEQMVDQLGRLPSRQVQIDILPGQTVGASLVELKAEAMKPWRLRLGYDNTGDKSAGENQLGLGLTWDSPLGLADQLSLYAARDAETPRWARSDNQRFQYSLPYGWWTASYSYSRNYYQSRYEFPGVTGFDFENHGDSRSHQLSLERLLHRDGASKTGASLGLMHLRTRNYLDDSLLEVSSHRLTELQVGVNHGRRIGSTFVNADLGWQRGIGALDAQGRGHPQGSAPDARYNKYTLTVSALHPFAVAGESFSMESLAWGQHSEDALFSPQRVGLGGLASVRGFKEQTLYGNSGGYWRNQLRWSKSVAWHPVVSGVSVALGYDIGAIARNKRQDDEALRLSGHALEITAQGPYGSASVTVARALEHPAGVKREHPVYFNLNLTY